VIQHYSSVEDKEITKALELNTKNIQETEEDNPFLREDNPLLILQKLLNPQIIISNNPFIRLTNSIEKLNQNYIGAALQSNLTGSKLDKICGTDTEPKIAHPLRSTTVAVLTELDRFRPLAIQNYTTMDRFIQGTEKLIEMCSASKYLYRKR
jgi:hypothetical protein